MNDTDEIKYTYTYAPDSLTIAQPERSGWRCEMFGMGNMVVVFPSKQMGHPNWFWRIMQYLLIGNKWIKDDKV